MECMNAIQYGYLYVYPFIPIAKPYGICDPLYISDETFLGLGRGLICWCFGIVVGQL
jgi:hypothetical protein